MDTDRHCNLLFVLLQKQNNFVHSKHYPAGRVPFDLSLPDLPRKIETNSWKAIGIKSHANSWKISYNNLGNNRQVNSSLVLSQYFLHFAFPFGVGL